jgi:formylglycine-generating enzyme required for sulfatase activity
MNRLPAAALALLAALGLWSSAGTQDGGADPLVQAPVQAHLLEDAGMVRIGGFSIDLYEYPNQAGAVPTTEVTWEEAQALCRARGKRLCAEEEWEAACRGPRDLLYGYGPQFESGRCNTPYQVEGTWRRDRGLAPSGSFAGCATEYGVYDLIGNAWEWTDGWYDRGRAWRMVRGGSWFHSANLGRADARYGQFLTAEYRLDLVGFRCCRSVPAAGPAE